MRSVVLIIFTIISILADSPNKELWEKFKKDHNKTYTTSQEDQHRFSVFVSNLQTINRHNVKYQNGEESYHMGITPFADLTHEEFLKRIANSNIAGKNVVEAFPIDVNNIQQPEQFDWRTQEGVVLEVPDEGKCEASWAFSTTGAIEGQNFLKKEQSIKLSAQELVDCISLGDYNSGCDGGDTTRAFEYSQVKGLLAESEYSWRGETQSICADYNQTRTTKIKEYKKVYSSISATEFAVAYIGPMSAVVDASGMQFYSGGVYFNKDCLNANQITHGVLLVGYSMDYWITRHSWGLLWGEDGYMKLTKQEHYDCGITTNVVYPMVE